MANNVTINVTGNSGSAQSALSNLNASSQESGGFLDKLRGSLLSLAPAAAPMAAAVVPLAGAMASAGVASAAFTAALIPQISAISEVSKAQDKYDQAVEKSGKNSTQAQAALKQLVQETSKLPPETQKAAVALKILKDSFASWSNSLASSTVPVFTKSLAVANDLLPKTTGLVKGAAAQFDRLVTAAGGAVNTPGFDALTQKFTVFANRTLTEAVDGVLHFSRVLSEGRASGPISEFMDYARKNGPLVRDTLMNLGAALLHVGEAASAAGPGMLSIVNALSQVIAAVPPELLTRLIQLYTAFRFINLASVGLMAAGTRITALGASLTAMRTAATGATGATASVTAAFGTLSTGAKLGIATAAIIGTVLAIKQLTSAGKSAPTDIGRLSTSIGQLGRTGQLSGELVRVYGNDLGDLTDAFDLMSKGISNNKIIQGLDKLSSGFGLFGKGEIQDAKDKINDFDDSLADLVKGGKSDLAEAAVKRLSDQWVAAGKPAEEFTQKLDDYRSALDDAAFESDLAAESMGSFGKQAQEVQKKLDAQKRAAEGLTQAIFDLNDANRAGLDAEADYQQAVDDATKMIKGHEKALHLVNGELDLNSQAARDAYGALSTLAGAIEESAKSTLEQTGSQEKANRKLIEGHAQLVKLGRQMGLSAVDAQKFADKLDNIKDPKISITARTDRLRAAIADANKRLLAFAHQRPTTRLRADAAQLKNVIRDAQARINQLTQSGPIIIRATYTEGLGNVYHEGGGYAHGGVVGRSGLAGRAASGGPRSNLTWVGENGPELVDLAPGSTVHTNSDSRRMAASGAPSAQRVVLELRSSGSAVDDMLLKILREAVRGRGGVVQTALMGRG